MRSLFLGLVLTSVCFASPYSQPKRGLKPADLKLAKEICESKNSFRDIATAKTVMLKPFCKKGTTPTKLVASFQDLDGKGMTPQDLAFLKNAKFELQLYRYKRKKRKDCRFIATHKINNRSRSYYAATGGTFRSASGMKLGNTQIAWINVSDQGNYSFEPAVGTGDRTRDCRKKLTLPIATSTAGSTVGSTAKLVLTPK